jgi:penicillin-binding protein 2
VGTYADGKYDQTAERGKDLMLGIDTELQALGERLMQHKKGSIVAIDPQSGEILAFVSAPTYDPNALTGREFSKNWRQLRSDSLNPLYNRPLMARYPPGSIFKIPLALTALSEGIIQPNTFYRCGGGFWRNGGKPGCHAHASPLALENAIRYSCNAYFSATYMDFLHADKWTDFYQGYNTWYEYMQEFGFGRELGIDIPYEVPGLIPTASRYDKWYGEGRWVATTVISNAIGQGEILMTPLQMANLAAILANRGYYRVPHFVKAMRQSKSQDWVGLYHEEKRTRIAPRHFEFVIEAMAKVVESGTATRAQIPDIAVCGKTGTVENPHGKDHSVFIAFAPKDNPRIAIATIVENCGFGGTWAAPICSLMMEKFLKGEIDETSWKYKRIVDANFIDP